MVNVFNFTAPKVSVVVPVFNAAPYLMASLETFLAQTLSEWEVIYVDDGSTDGSLDILKSFQLKDARIHVIAQQNSGSGMARNRGLLSTKGEYVFFMDVDDLIDPETLALSHAKAVASDLDVVIFGAYSCQMDGEKILAKKPHSYSYQSLPKKYLTGIFSAESVGEDIFSFPSSVWTKLYRRTFLLENQIQFQDIPRGQDQLFFFHIMITAKRMAILERDLYYYRKNNKATKEAKGIQRNTWAIDTFFAVEKLLENLGLKERYLPVALERYFSKALSGFAKSEPGYRDIYFEKLRALSAYLRREGPEGWWRYVRVKKDANYFQLKCAIFCGRQRARWHRLFSIKNRGATKHIRIFGLHWQSPRRERFSKHAIDGRLTRGLSIGVQSQQRTPKVIVSLTSFPDRIPELQYTLYSLLSQSFKPDEVILWLSKEEFLNGEGSLPSEILAFKQPGLSIQWCDNLGSYKKLVPALARNPEDIIVTADDDLFYHRDWLKFLYQAYLQYPHCIIGHRIHRIICDENGIALPYRLWEKNAKGQRPSFRYMATSGSGALFPPHALHTDAIRREKFTQYAPTADDLWFWAMAVLNHTQVKSPENALRRLSYVNIAREFSDSATRLSCANLSGGNDRQMNEILRAYPAITDVLLSRKAHA